MHKETVQTISDIYENDAPRGKFDNNQTRTKSSGHLLTGNDSVRMRISRAAVVCLVLLCFLLLTVVIALSVTNNIQERELLTMITSLTKEKTLLLTNITDLTKERDALLTRNTDLTEERDELTIKTISLSTERDQFKFKNGNLTNARNQLNNTLQTVDGWTYYVFSFYYLSNETKSWTESRQDCQQRGADLIIINNRQENDFIMNVTRGKECWIGVTDVEVEGRWKWVDGTYMASGMWAPGEPNGGTVENCVVTYLKRLPSLLGWIDEPCSKPYQWICEKNISPLIQP